MLKKIYIPLDTTLQNTVNVEKLIKRGDTLELTIKIFADGVLADLTNETVFLALRKTDGTNIDKTISNISNGILTVQLEENATLSEGWVNGELIIYDGTTIEASTHSSTNTFSFFVVSTLTDDILNKISTDDIQTLADLRNSIENTMNAIENYVTNITTIAGTAESVEALVNTKTYIDSNLAALQLANAEALVNFTNEDSQNDRAETNIATLQTFRDVTGEFQNLKIEVQNARGTETSLDVRLDLLSSKIASMNVITNIKEYGEVGDGSDATQAFIDAIANTSVGGIVLIPQGDYLLSTVIVDKPITFVGESGTFVGATKIIAKNANGNVFNITSEGVLFNNIKFTSNIVQTSGVYINGVNMPRISISNCFFEKYYLAINFDGGSELTIKESQFFNGTSDSISSGSGAVRLGKNNYTGAIKIDNCYLKNESDTLQTNFGIFCGFVDVLDISSTTIIQHGNDLYVKPIEGQTASLIFADETMFDTSVNGIVFNTEGTGVITRCGINNCWMGEHSQTAIEILNSTGVIDGISISDNHILNNDSCGFNIDGTSISNLKIKDNFIAGNTLAGIRLSGTIADIDIQGNTIGKCDNSIKNGTGLMVSTSVTGNVANNIFTQNDTNISNNSTTLLVGDNVGLDWNQYTPTISTSSGTITTSVRSGKYTVNGKKVSFSLTVNITTNGTGSGAVILSLPFSAKYNFACSGRGAGVSSKMLQAFCSSNSSNLVIYNFDGTYPGSNGEVLILSGQYEMV